MNGWRVWWWPFFLLLPRPVVGFFPPGLVASKPRIGDTGLVRQRRPLPKSPYRILWKSRRNNSEENNDLDSRTVVERVVLPIQPDDTKNDNSERELSPETLQHILDHQPSPWAVWKELLGINLFTYLLALLIVIFGTLNMVVGPGWLGQTNLFHIQGSGTFTQQSENLPSSIDLSAPQYRL